MPNFESAPKTNESAGSVGEKAGEAPRGVSAERGRKTFESYKAERLKQIDKRLAEINAELTMLRDGNKAEQDKAPINTEPENTEPSGSVAEQPESTQPEPEQSSETVPPVVPIINTGEAAPDSNVSETPAEAAVETAAEGSEATSEPTPESSEEGEKEEPTAEQIQTTTEKAKKNRNLKTVLTHVAAGAIAAGILVGGIFIGSHKNNNDNKPNPNSEAATVTQIEEAETERGIYDGYGEKGMWLSEGKAGPYNFAKASEVAEVCENDECEMIKYTAKNQVESFADYLANLPEELQPEGFKGLSILETETKLESLSPEDYDKTLEYFNDVMDDAFTRRVTINGSQNNAYMALKDRSGDVKHGNMQLVKCVTNEQGLEVTEFYWPTKDGAQEMGSMRVKLIPVYDEEGAIVGFEGCEQVVTPVGENNKIYDNLPEIVPDDPTPTPEVTPPPVTPPPVTPPPVTPTPVTPTPEIAPKDAENLTRIDDNIQEDIAEDIGSGEVQVEKTSVDTSTITEKPAPESYEGTEATIVQNDASKTAESVAPPASPENNYSEDLGGANAGEYAPVQADEAAQAAADAAETAIEEAPVEGEALDDILSDLGIN